MNRPKCSEKYRKQVENEDRNYRYDDTNENYRHLQSPFLGTNQSVLIINSRGSRSLYTPEIRDEVIRKTVLPNTSIDRPVSVYDKPKWINQDPHCVIPRDTAPEREKPVVSTIIDKQIVKKNNLPTNKEKLLLNNYASFTTANNLPAKFVYYD